MNIAIQLAFNGKCREAFEFYQEVLGGEIVVMNTFGSSDADLPPGSVAADAEMIRFGEIRVGNYSIRGNDLRSSDYKPMQGFNISVHTDTPEEARRIFAGLADGGTVLTPLSEVAWSSAFGIVKDRFDVPWLILAVDRDQFSR